MLNKANSIIVFFIYFKYLKILSSKKINKAAAGDLKGMGKAGLKVQVYVFFAGCSEIVIILIRIANILTKANVWPGNASS